MNVLANVAAGIALGLALGCQSERAPAVREHCAPVLNDVRVSSTRSEGEFKALHDLPTNDAPSPRGEMIKLADGTQAYLSLPIAAHAPLPGIVMIHEWWGLNRNIRWWADRMASEGYAVIAVDLYGGVVAETREAASEAIVAVDDAKALATMRAAHERLITDERVRAPRTGSIGWSFGGRQALLLAIGEPDLDAVVMYYGNPVVEPDKLASLNAEGLAIFGTLDESILSTTVEEFRAALSTAKKDFQILPFDAEHAFANPSSERYDEIAAAEAWEYVRAFFARTLLDRN